MPSEQTAATGRSTVVDYWPRSAGTVLQYEGRREKNGELLATERLLIRVEDDAEIEGRSVGVQRVETTIDYSDGRSNTGSVTVYQHVDDESTFTRAVEYPNGGLHMVSTPMIDLRAPIEAGTSWMSRHLENYFELDIDGQVAMTYTSTIVAVNEPRTVGVRVIEDCLKVVEVGVSAGNHEARCADTSVHEAKILVDRTRWWCRGLGGVEETTTVAAVRVRDNDLPCAEIRSSYRLLSVENGPPS